MTIASLVPLTTTALIPARRLQLTSPVVDTRSRTSPDTRRQLLDAGVEPNFAPSDRLANLIASEVIRFTAVAGKAGIAVDQ
jgi:hypothetical protein